MSALGDDRGMLLLLVVAHMLNVYVIDDELVNLRAGGLAAAHRSLGRIVHHVVWPQATLAHVLT